jgi:hypothetical protein
MLLGKAARPSRWTQFMSGQRVSPRVQILARARPEFYAGLKNMARTRPTHWPSPPGSGFFQAGRVGLTGSGNPCSGLCPTFFFLTVTTSLETYYYFQSRDRWVYSPCSPLCIRPITMFNYIS